LLGHGLPTYTDFAKVIGQTVWYSRQALLPVYLVEAEISTVSFMLSPAVPT